MNILCQNENNTVRKEFFTMKKLILTILAISAVSCLASCKANTNDLPNNTADFQTSSRMPNNGEVTDQNGIIGDSDDRVIDRRNPATKIGNTVNNAAKNAGDIVNNAAHNAGDVVNNVADKAGDTVQNIADNIGDTVKNATR